MRALALVLLVGCATSHSSEQKADARVSQTVTSDEGEWTRKTWEFGGGTGPGVLPVVPPAQRESPAVTDSVAPAVPETGHPRIGRDSYGTGGLIRYTEETHAASKTTTATQAQLDEQSATKSTLRVGLSLWTKLALGVAAVAALALLWHFRKGLLP